MCLQFIYISLLSFKKFDSLCLYGVSKTFCVNILIHVLRVCIFINSIISFAAIVTSNSTTTEPYVNTTLAWSDYVNPCGLLLLYFHFSFEINRTHFERVCCINR